MGRTSSKVGGGGGGFQLITAAKQFKSSEEADAFFEGNLDSLTSLEKKALRWYTGGAYEAYNEALRKGENNHPNRTKSIDSAMEKSVLTEPITVYRGSTADLLGFGYTPSISEIQALVGESFHDRAVVSSSATYAGAFKHKPIMYEITVPPGKGRGQYIDKVSHFAGHEKEFLMKRNTHFRITGVEEKGGKPYVKLQVID